MLAQLDSLPGHESEDIYGRDAKLEITSPTFQWSNATAASEGPASEEQKEEFAEIVKSIESLADSGVDWNVDQGMLSTSS